MRRIALVSALALLALWCTQAQAVLIQSWENTQAGWSVVTAENGTYSVAGYSTTNGVTDGTYAVTLTGPAPPSYGQMWRSTSNMGNTAILANAASISVDVFVENIGSPIYQQWDLTYNNADTSYQSIDGYSFSQSPVIGQQSTLTWTVPASLNAIMAASANPTALFFQVGGGGGSTFHIDNLRYTAIVPEPATLSLLGIGSLGLFLLARRRK